jgi:hypothetical protein
MLLKVVDLEAGGIIVGPNAGGTAKRRDTALHGNSGAGEHRGVASGPDQVSGAGKQGIVRRGRNGHGDYGVGVGASARRFSLRSKQDILRISGQKSNRRRRVSAA